MRTLSILVALCAMTLPLPVASEEAATVCEAGQGAIEGHCYDAEVLDVFAAPQDSLLRSAGGPSSDADPIARFDGICTAEGECEGQGRENETYTSCLNGEPLGTLCAQSRLCGHHGCECWNFRCAVEDNVRGCFEVEVTNRC